MDGMASSGENWTVWLLVEGNGVGLQQFKVFDIQGSIILYCIVIIIAKGKLKCKVILVLN
jgi:hypothetical protein